MPSGMRQYTKHKCSTWDIFCLYLQVLDSSLGRMNLRFLSSWSATRVRFAISWFICWCSKWCKASHKVKFHHNHFEWHQLVDKYQQIDLNSDILELETFKIQDSWLLKRCKIPPLNTYRFDWGWRQWYCASLHVECQFYNNMIQFHILIIHIKRKNSLRLWQMRPHICDKDVCEVNWQT